jgi:hypothetical protein
MSRFMSKDGQWAREDQDQPDRQAKSPATIQAAPPGERGGDEQLMEPAAPIEAIGSDTIGLAAKADRTRTSEHAATLDAERRVDGGPEAALAATARLARWGEAVRSNIQHGHSLFMVRLGKSTTLLGGLFIGRLSAAWDARTNRYRRSMTHAPFTVALALFKAAMLG